MSNKLKTKKMETRRNLYESALHLFKKEGYNNVSVDDIVAFAGTSKGTFYNYYTSKSQIIIERFKEIDNEYIKIYKKIRKQPGTKNKLLLFSRMQHQYIQENIGCDTLQIVFASLLNEKGADYIDNEKRPIFVVLNKIISEGQKHGEIRSDLSSYYITKTLVHCMRGIFYDWCVQNGRFNLIKVGNTYIKSILEGFIISPSNDL